LLAVLPLDDASKTSPVRFAFFIVNVSSEIVGLLLSNAAERGIYEGGALAALLACLPRH
jgi:hypothetical protein